MTELEKKAVNKGSTNFDVKSHHFMSLFNFTGDLKIDADISVHNTTC